ncbi:Dyp-type peroxidase [Aliiglaciecola sp. CAU 1673]|uniref:Dyp-type peroxidase n=1 Tax=Aliiglaciecola sp. CAU 1673 TaxID=3032595 RepID=UPI0023DB96AD|nr:Dyp-type peroxidase [Aliiglaciecola sp. CAU 1673]MDF2176757.1 Dyp-type peroxidase [Aliiglaciecola sp. CAU 1673]
MSQPQKGVCAEPNLHALYLLFNIIDDDAAKVRRKLARMLDIFDFYDEDHYEAMVSGMVAIGSSYWPELYPGPMPRRLAPFPDVRSEDRVAPAEPFDLFIQIRADRADVCHAIGMEITALLGEQAELMEQVKGFRYMDGRDLTGFVDGADNPKGMKKFDVALVGDEDEDFAGGSYVHFQRFRHDMDRWSSLSVAEQEMIMGRYKADNRPLPPTQMPAFAHARRCSLRDSHGEPIGLLTQNMPYGDMKVQGLMMVACSRLPEVYRHLLQSRIIGDKQGHYDKLLDYSRAEAGAAFFAPSASFIKRHKGG